MKSSVIVGCVRNWEIWRFGDFQGFVPVRLHDVETSLLSFNTWFMKQANR